MSELSALRAIGRGLEESSAARRAANKAVKTATGRTVDLSRGFNVRGPDGLKIPFKSDTPLEKAQEWTKNFYRPTKDFEFAKISVQSGEDGMRIDQVRLQDKTDGNNFIDFDDREDAIHVMLSKVSSKSRGKGVGAGLYRQLFQKAEQEGKVVRSDTAMTDASIAIWQRFKQLGYNIKENPRKRMMSGGWENASDPNAPLFEYTPKKPVEKRPEKVPIKEPPIDKEVDAALYQLRGLEGIDPMERERLQVLWAKYAETENPELGRRIIERANAAAKTGTPKKASEMTKLEPGIYKDEDGGGYYQISEDGTMTSVDPNATR